MSIRLKEAEGSDPDDRQNIHGSQTARMSLFGVCGTLVRVQDDGTRFFGIPLIGCVLT